MSKQPEYYIHALYFFNKIIKNHPRSAVTHLATITVNRKYGHDEARLRTAMAFGFGDDIEYANAYPGGSKMESEIARLINLNVDVLDATVSNKILNSIATSYGSDAKYDPKDLKEMLLRFFDGESPHLMATVTIADVRRCWAFANVSNDDLWFCIDWRG